MADLAGERIHYVPLVHDGQRPQLRATVTHEAGRAVVEVHGEMDLASAPEFEGQVRELLALPVDAVTLDLDGLTFIDSSGLRALTAIHAAAEERRVALALRSVPNQARTVLELTHLADKFLTED